MNGKQLIIKYSESIIWGTALVTLFFMNPGSSVSLCPLKALGMHWCPGCGIGHSIHSTLHFDFRTAWQEHVLGIPVTAVLIFQTIKSLPQINKNKYYEPRAGITDYTGY